MIGFFNEDTGTYEEFTLGAGRKPPSKYKSVMQEIVEASRTVTGTMKKERIAEKMQITVEWSAIPAQQKADLLKWTGLNTFQVKYYDTMTDTIKYGEFYRGNDLDVNPLRRYDTEKGFDYYSVKMSLTEV